MSWVDGYRRFTALQKEAMREILEGLEAGGIVSHTRSPYMASVLMVPKPGGKWRLCVDLRRCNEWVIPRPVQMPEVEELLERIGKARYLGKVDVMRGFWCLPVSQGREFTGFTCPVGNFCFNRLPMGLMTSPGEFQERIPCRGGFSCRHPRAARVP
jgi:hypothetical protein